LPEPAGTSPRGNSAFTFLTLLPVHGASFPSNPEASRPSAVAARAPIEPTTAAMPVPEEAEPAADDMGDHHRRSSSVSSSGASGSERRHFLKLGPVYWGGNRGEADWTPVEE